MLLSFCEGKSWEAGAVTRGSWSLHLYLLLIGQKSLMSSSLWTQCHRLCLLSCLCQMAPQNWEMCGMKWSRDCRGVIIRCPLGWDCKKRHQWHQQVSDSDLSEAELALCYRDKVPEIIIFHRKDGTFGAHSFWGSAYGHVDFGLLIALYIVAEHGDRGSLFIS